MRMIFGVLSLLLVVAVLGFLARKQLRAVNDIKVPTMSAPAGSDAPAITDATPALPTGNAQQRSQQIQQQFKAAAEAAVQQARPSADEK